MRSTFARIRNAPLFPIVPLVPLILGGTLLMLEAFALARLRRLACSLEELLESQRAQPA